MSRAEKALKSQDERMAEQKMGPKIQPWALIGWRDDSFCQLHSSAVGDIWRRDTDVGSLIETIYICSVNSLAYQLLPLLLLQLLLLLLLSLLLRRRRTMMVGDKIGVIGEYNL